MPGVNSSSLGKVIDVRVPIKAQPSMSKIGKGAGHSLQIGATIVTDLAIMPQVPTDVLREFAGKILSSVKLTYVVMINDMMMPIFRMRIMPGITFSSKASRLSLSAIGITFV